MTKTKQIKTFLMNHGRLSEIVIREERNNDMKIIKVQKKTCPSRLKRLFFSTVFSKNSDLAFETTPATLSVGVKEVRSLLSLEVPVCKNEWRKNK